MAPIPPLEIRAYHSLLRHEARLGPSRGEGIYWDLLESIAGISKRQLHDNAFNSLSPPPSEARIPLGDAAFTAERSISVSPSSFIFSSSSLSPDPHYSPDADAHETPVPTAAIGAIAGVASIILLVIGGWWLIQRRKMAAKNSRATAVALESGMQDGEGEGGQRRYRGLSRIAKENTSLSLVEEERDSEVSASTSPSIKLGFSRPSSIDSGIGRAYTANAGPSASTPNLVPAPPAVMTRHNVSRKPAPAYAPSPTRSRPSMAEPSSLPNEAPAARDEEPTQTEQGQQLPPKNKHRRRSTVSLASLRKLSLWPSKDVDDKLGTASPGFNKPKKPLTIDVPPPTTNFLRVAPIGGDSDASHPPSAFTPITPSPPPDAPVEILAPSPASALAAVESPSTRRLSIMSILPSFSTLASADLDAYIDKHFASGGNGQVDLERELAVFGSPQAGYTDGFEPYYPAAGEFGLSPRSSLGSEKTWNIAMEKATPVFGDTSLDASLGEKRASLFVFPAPPLSAILGDAMSSSAPTTPSDTGLNTPSPSDISQPPSTNLSHTTLGFIFTRDQTDFPSSPAASASPPTPDFPRTPDLASPSFSSSLSFPFSPRLGFTSGTFPSRIPVAVKPFPSSPSLSPSPSPSLASTFPSFLPRRVRPGQSSPTITGSLRRCDAD